MSGKSGRCNIRLVVVSNRVPAIDQSKSAAGGLAVALRQALDAHGGIWFGWSGATTTHPAAAPRTAQAGNITYAVVDLSPEDKKEYYSGYANRGLWPTMHYRLGLARFERADYEGYRRVNQRFADILQGLIRPGDLVWIHDYHLVPLAAELRQRGVRNPIGYFHHIPWPPPEVLGALPGSRQLIASLGAYDVIGLQTDGDQGNLVRTLEQELGAEITNGGAVALPGRKVVVRPFPIGIDPGVFERAAGDAMASRTARTMVSSLGGTRLVIGVDRLDYSKGLVQRLEAFRDLLRAYPTWRRNATMLQIAPTSRSEVPEYAEMSRQLNEVAGRINSAMGEPDWTPIRLVKKTYPHAVLAGFYRAAGVALVTPMRDGMNLVAKEYVAAQDPGNPGVLVLSRFAGAARQMGEALIVNPFDSMEVADALNEALTMPLEERIRRWAALRRGIITQDISWWTNAFLNTLSNVR